MIEPCRPSRSRSIVVDIAGRHRHVGPHRVDRGVIVGVEDEVGDGEVRRQMAAIARADDDGGDALAAEHPAAGDCGDVGAVPVGDLAQRPEQGLEHVPAADFLDDQLVFGERPVFQRHLGSGDAQPFVAQKPAGDGAVAQELECHGRRVAATIWRSGRDGRAGNIAPAWRPAARRPRTCPRHEPYRN